MSKVIIEKFHEDFLYKPSNKKIAPSYIKKALAKFNREDEYEDFYDYLIVNQVITWIRGNLNVHFKKNDVMRVLETYFLNEDWTPKKTWTENSTSENEGSTMWLNQSNTSSNIVASDLVEPLSDVDLYNENDSLELESRVVTNSEIQADLDLDMLNVNQEEELLTLEPDLDISETESVILEETPTIIEPETEMISDIEIESDIIVWDNDIDLSIEENVSEISFTESEIESDLDIQDNNIIENQYEEPLVDLNIEENYQENYQTINIEEDNNINISDEWNISDYQGIDESEEIVSDIEEDIIDEDTDLDNLDLDDLDLVLDNLDIEDDNNIIWEEEVTIENIVEEENNIELENVEEEQEQDLNQVYEEFIQDNNININEEYNQDEIVESVTETEIIEDNNITEEETTINNIVEENDEVVQTETIEEVVEEKIEEVKEEPKVSPVIDVMNMDIWDFYEEEPSKGVEEIPEDPRYSYNNVNTNTESYSEPSYEEPVKEEIKEEVSSNKIDSWFNLSKDNMFYDLVEKEHNEEEERVEETNYSTTSYNNNQEQEEINNYSNIREYKEEVVESKTYEEPVVYQKEVDQDLDTLGLWFNVIDSTNNVSRNNLSEERVENKVRRIEDNIVEEEVKRTSPVFGFSEVEEEEVTVINKVEKKDGLKEVEDFYNNLGDERDLVTYKEENKSYGPVDKKRPITDKVKWWVKEYLDGLSAEEKLIWVVVVIIAIILWIVLF